MCDGFVPQSCTPFINCTGSEFISNWTEFCCQPEAVKNTRYWMLSIIGMVGVVGTFCNILTICTFGYLYFFPVRIKKKFGQEFAMTKDPVFLLILHLSLCDLLYCLSGLPTYWDVYYHGYYPYSHAMCQYSAFFRNTIAYADFHTIALISAYFAWRRKRGQQSNSRYGAKPVLGMIVGVWVYSFCITCIPLMGLCGQLGFDPKHGKCKVISCESCSEGSYFTGPPGGIVLAVSIGIPSIVILISYTMVYNSLAKVTADMDTSNLRKSVLILVICYFSFILPILIIEWLPEDIYGKAVIGVFVYSWYWCIYVINFFIYIIFWRRVRMGIQIFLKDMFGKPEIQTNANDISNSHSSIWWRDLQRLEN